jgi:phosphosulfolactate synthase
MTQEVFVDSTSLDLPERTSKPRHDGLTMVIDNGVPHGLFADAVATAAPYIDVVKFGWGTAMVTPDLDRKLGVLSDLGISYHFGGTLFEKFVVQDRFDSFVALCRRYRCDTVEVSNGTIPLSNTAKAAYIRKCAGEFRVISEVGFKDCVRASALGPSDWVDAINEDLEAGATKVITEARESGCGGICDSDGKPRRELIEAILGSGVDPQRLIFEAPTRQLQTYFLTLLGPNVNLGNVAPAEVISLETLRVGLRADTLMHFERIAHARFR